MPRIINTFASSNPLAESIKSLGNTMFGGTPMSALDKQKLADAQRATMGAEELARTFGSATDGAVNFNRAAEAGVLAGLKPDDVAMFTNYLAGNITGPRSDLTTNAMAGAGKYKDSAENLDFDRSNVFNMNEANNRQSGANNKYLTDVQASTSIANNTADNTRLWDEFLQKPIEATVDGQPRFVQQGQATTTPNAAPVLSENELGPVDKIRQFNLAADVAMPDATPEQKRAWVLQQISKSQNKGIRIGADGSVEIGGDGGFGPTNAVETQLQKSDINYEKFKSTLSMAREVAAANPNIFGIVGTGRQVVQDSAQIAKSLADVFGIKNIEGTIAGMQQDAAANGLDPGIFSPQYDPALGQIESLGKILAYSGASTIAGQTGNDMSNKDVQNISQILGDPRDWAMNQQRFLTKLQQVEDYVNAQQAVNDKYLFGKSSLAAPPAPSAPAAPAAAPPAAPPQKIINGKTFVQQNGQWFEVAP